jgi:UDP-glucuronate 4-epimerase
VRHSPLAQVAGSEDARVLLVTGSAGFVGFHAAAALRRGGAGVVGLDNFNAYYSVGLKRARAAELEALGVHTVHADLNDGDAVRRSPRLPLAR